MSHSGGLEALQWKWLACRGLPGFGDRTPGAQRKRRDSKIKARIALALFAVLLLSPSIHAQVVAHQGAPDPTEFRSPMVLDTVFLASDPAKWKSGAWISGAEWAELGRYHCDNVSIGTLSARVKEQVKGNVTFELRSTLTNRKGHDKEVRVRYELLDHDQVIATTTLGPFQLDEEKSKTKTVLLAVPKLALTTDPMTPMRVTVSARDN